MIKIFVQDCYTGVKRHQCGDLIAKERQQFCNPFFVLSLIFFYFLQASQAAQEAEDNARKAKNSVNSLLTVINDLLDQLGRSVFKVIHSF